MKFSGATRAGGRQREAGIQKIIVMTTQMKKKNQIKS